MVVLGRQLKTLSIPCQACNDAAMLLRQSRAFERPAKLRPFQPWFLQETSPLKIRQVVHGRRESTDGLFDAFVRRRQFEPRVKRFQMGPKFLAEREGDIRLSGGLAGHDTVNDTVWGRP